MSCTRAASCSLGTGARNMTDYIERKAAFDAAQEHFCDSARTLEAIETLPAADVRLVVRGRWENFRVKPCGRRTTMDTIFVPAAERI